MNLYKHRYCIALLAVVFTQACTILGQTTSTCFVGGIVLSGSVATDVYNRSTGATATYSITSYTTAGTCPTVTWSFSLNGVISQVASYTFATSTPAYSPAYTNLNVSATSAGVADQSVVTLKINQLSSNESGIIVFAVNAVTNSASSPPLQILDCKTSTGSGVIVTPTSPLSCGFGCTVQYSCASGYNGNDLNATCQEDATFDASPICTSIACLNSDLPCSNPQYCFIQTGSTNAGANVTTQCKTGYNGSVSATCGIDGNWTITTQSPCPALCPVSDITPSPGRCTNATGDILEGQSITVTCCNGYEGASTMAVCTSDRSWSNLPTCTKPADTTVMTTDESVTSTASTTSTIRNDSNGGSRSKPLSDGAIAGIVIGCLIAVAIIIFFLIPICCAEICCCTFTILCLSWGTKKPDPEPDITIPELKKNTQPDGPNGEGVEP